MCCASGRYSKARTLMGLSLPSPSQGLPLPHRCPRTPFEPPWTVRPSPGDATAGPISSSLQTCPIQSLTLLNQAHLQVHTPAWPQPMPREIPDNHSCGCSDAPRWPGWNSGTGPSWYPLGTPRSLKGRDGEHIWIRLYSK